MGSGGLAPTNCLGGTPHVRDPASAARRGRGPRGERHAARHQATDILRGNGFTGRLFPKTKLHGMCFQWSSPNLQVAANSRVWMRSIVSETLRRHTDARTVCQPNARPPVCTPSAFSASRCFSSLTRNLSRLAGISFCADGVSVRSHCAMSDKC